MKDKTGKSAKPKKNKKGLYIYLILALCALILGVVAGFIYEYHKVSYRYYDDIVDSYGLPLGINELSEEQASRREYTFRLEYKRTPLGEPGAFGWRINAMSIINGYGRVVNINEDEGIKKYPHQEYEYDRESGLLRETKLFGTTNNLICTYSYSQYEGKDVSIVDVKYELKGQEVDASDDKEAIFSVLDKVYSTTNITRYLYERDNLGRITRISYHGNKDTDLRQNMICNKDGVFGMHYSYNNDGRVKTAIYLDKDMQPYTDSLGICGEDYLYDQRSRTVCHAYRNANGELVENQYGWAYCVKVKDKYGNDILEKYYSWNKKPCFEIGGYTSVHISHDEHGNIQKKKYFGIDDKLCINRDGYAICKSYYDEMGNKAEEVHLDTHGERVTRVPYRLSIKYDDRGNVIERAYYNDKDSLMTDQNRYSIIRYRYNNNDWVTDISYYDENDKPCYNRHHYHCNVYTYDKYGRVTEINYLGTNNRLCVAFGSYAKVKYTYDMDKMTASCSVFNHKNKPVYFKGVNTWRCKYDSLGYMSEKASFDEKGNPCVNNQAFSIERFKRNDRGEVVNISYYSRIGRPCLSIDRIHRIEILRNESGKETERTFYDTQDSVCQGRSYAIRKREIDMRGNIIRESYYDENEELMSQENLGDAAIVEYEYDKYRRIISSSFYNRNGHLVGPISTVNRQYDRFGNQITQFYYDNTNELSNLRIGEAYWVSTFDDYSKETSTTFYNEKDVMCDDEKLGYARAEYEYDKHGDMISMKMYDSKNKLLSDNCASIIYKYDRYGQLIEKAFYDSNAKLFMSPEGYAIVRYKYDKFGNNIERSYYDDSGKPCLKDGIYFIEKAEYDDYSRVSKVSIFDIDNQPIENEDGAATIEVKYDRQGEVSEYVNYDEEGERVEN